MLNRGILVLVWLLVASAQEWSGNIVFQDNFDGNSLDLSKWEYQEGCKDYGAGNLECYNRNNVEVSNGKLMINVKQQEQEAGKPFTSGRIRQSTAYTYGAYVVSARLARGDHLWPAIWLFSNPNVNKCRYEEIDIAEYRGQPSESNNLEMAAHFGKGHDTYRSKGDKKPTPFDLSKEFHEYAVLWTPSEITWFIDKQSYYHVSTSDPIWSTVPSKDGCDNTFHQPFSVPEHFIFNVAVGGMFFNFTDGRFDKYDLNTWTKPNMEVDWVRIYQGPPNHPANELTNPSTNQESTSESWLNRAIEKVSQFIRP